MSGYYAAATDRESNKANEAETQFFTTAD
jgi:hypothetical protein